MPLRHPLLVAAVALCCVGASAAAQGRPAAALPDSIGLAVRIAAPSSAVLHGSLLLPTGTGPHPAIVLLEGSGGLSYRRSWKPDAFPFWKGIAEHLVSRGYAVLLFDKPGVHRSTGDWRRQAFDDRAADALAAVRLLAARADVDAGRVGVLGHSQGGWIAQLAAARAPNEIAFVVSLAGPAVSVDRQIRDDMHGGWRCGGVSGPERWLRGVGLRTGLGALGLVAHVATPTYLSRIINFDPRAVLPEVRQPMLALFAEHDVLVPPAANAARLARHFGTAHGNDALTVLTVPAADHGFRASDGCTARGPTPQWAPDFFASLDHAPFWSRLSADSAAAPTR